MRIKDTIPVKYNISDSHFFSVIAEYNSKARQIAMVSPPASCFVKKEQTEKNDAKNKFQ
jgi:hypothetical protein